MADIYNLAEECHIVQLLAPVDISGGVTPDIFSMELAAHVSIIIQAGVTGAASTVTIEECTSFAGAGNTAIAFAYYAEATAGGDTLSTRTAATNAGFATSTNDGIFYVIDIDASELSEGSHFVALVFSDPGANTFVSAVAVLTGHRYKEDPTATAII